MTLETLNRLPAPEAEAELLRCCGSRRWARELAGARPFADHAGLFAASDEHWNRLSAEDWLEAFAAHPRIGGTPAGAPGGTSQWAQAEQSGTTRASRDTLARLAAGNLDYEKRFGHIFIVCATGKSADEMLQLLESRMSNSPEAELRIAATEQAKITRIRLEKLLS